MHYQDHHERRRLVVEYVQNHNGCAVLDISVSTRVPWRTVYRILSSLRNAGIVKYEEAHGLFYGTNSSYSDEYILFSDLSKMLGISRRQFNMWQNDVGRTKIFKEKICRGRVCYIRASEVLSDLMKFRVGPPLDYVPQCMREFELSRKYNMHGKTMQYWRSRGLPYFKIDRMVFYVVSEFEEFLKNYVANPPYKVGLTNRLKSMLNTAQVCQ